MRSDLAKVPEIKEVATDLPSNTCQVVLKDKDFDLKSKLNELAKENDHLAGWSIEGS